MENVVAFNNELSGLYESKPPISKAKMSAITRSAMRAIKFYKHVVQSVEKFILKCKPEYKVPGLYVIDSIVRQSRHQFGPEKDVFAPRFARNMKDTFANLFRCAPEDKSRIIRVLNLWQKNNVFAPEVIQPIFDLADPNHPIYSMPPVGGAGLSGPGGSTTADVSQANGINTSSGSLEASMGVGPQAPDDKLPGGSGGLADLSSVSPHERSRTASSRQLEHKQHSSKRTNNATNMAASTSNSKSREHSKSTLESIKIHHPETYSKYQRNSSHDYEDSHHMLDDDDGSSVECETTKNSNNILDNNNLKQLLNDPNVLRQLQTLQNFTKFKQDDKQQQHLRMQEEAFEKHLQTVLKNTAAGSSTQQDSKEVEFVSEEMNIEVINLDGNDSRSPSPDRDRYKRRRSRSRSRSRDRGVRRRRSRSRSRSRSPRSNRRRNSRDRERNNRDKEKDRELERERRKKGLPDMKKDHLSVCSTTLWVGHLSKLVYQEELSDTFGEYGDIVSIDQIVPRGCAFIVMNRRQDAFKAMQGLKNHKLQGRAITISWAAGKGVKSKEWKDFWDLELGVTYIPWSKLNENTDFDALEEGGMFDEDTMPSWMKEKKKKLQEKAKESTLAGINLPSTPNIPPPGNPPLMFNIDTTQPPPGPPPTGGPPPLLPMVPGQFSMAPPMGAPPRMIGPPHMGMPISGLHMPPNIVPPHAAMMMMPGFGMPGQVPPGGGPPPMGPPHLPPMGAPHRHPAQYPPPMGGVAPAAPIPSSAGNVSSDDQMDIEMDEEDGAPSTDTTAPPPSGNSVNFNQPPPSFTSDNSALGGPNAIDNFGRDRNRGGGGGGPNSRWGGRGPGVGGGEDDSNESGGGRWRENGAGGPNFGDGGRNRPDFMNEFENRGGPRGGGGPNFNGGGDFHPNMQNRFNQPTNLMQMRIPPPNAFNQRGGPGGGGPPMFMRGQAGGPGGPGGRQQGPGFFNRNNAFERGGGGGGGDLGGGGGFGGRGRGGRGGIGGRGGRGGGMEGRGGRDRDVGGGGGGPNWSDDEGDDNGFKRRGGGNRFRDRDDDRHNNMRERGGRGGRGGLGGPGGRDRNDSDRDSRSQGRDNRSQGRDNRSQGRGVSEEANRRSSRDEIKNKPPISDTEEDWDKELEDYEGKNDKKTTTATTTQNTFRGGDDGPTSSFKADSENSRRNSDTETPIKIQVQNKFVDPDEENWDDDEDDNRPLPTKPQQEAREASPAPTTAAAAAANDSIEDRISSNDNKMTSGTGGNNIDQNKSESPLKNEQSVAPPTAVADTETLATPSAPITTSDSAEATAAVETET